MQRSYIADWFSSENQSAISISGGIATSEQDGTQVLEIYNAKGTLTGLSKDYFENGKQIHEEYDANGKMTNRTESDMDQSDSENISGGVTYDGE